MSERELRGLAAAGGMAVGKAFLVREPELEAAGDGGPEEQERALEALAWVGQELGDSAERLRALGLVDEAEILEANRLMAEDPVLVEQVRELAGEVAAVAAVRDATEHHAQLLAAVPDPLFAARAADARQLGQRAARFLSGGPALVAPTDPVVLIGRDLGPADVADLDLASGHIRGIALAEGAATSHAAIMARALGLPMVVGLGAAVLEVTDDERLVLDGDRGLVVLAPSEGTLQSGHAEVRRMKKVRHQLAAERGFPATTRDGRRIRLLCNAAGVAEVRAGLDAGAEGVGLLRTELAFLDAAGWPTESEHAAALAPALAALAGRVATVRTLDFGADKTPPFLAGIAERGLALSLLHEEPFAAQLRAILRSAGASELRLLLPLVGSAEELRRARVILDRCIEESGWTGAPPALGAMIETPEAVERLDEIAEESDFLSIGTNDLVQYTLGLDRELPLATAQAAADPTVLRLIETVARTARREGLSVEICGEAASELPLVVLFVGLGIDELSVSPARLDEVRSTVRRLTLSAAEEAAALAVAETSAEAALERGRELLGQAGHESDEPLDSLGGAVA
jgi:phosphoenolpyruvate-protein phosphotransferase